MMAIIGDSTYTATELDLMRLIFFIFTLTSIDEYRIVLFSIRT